MRQIKFRGKSNTTGEWVYGDLLQMEIKTPYIVNISPIEGESLKTDIVPVEPESVGQFTGIIDCVGQEVYEGDIVTWKNIYYNGEEESFTGNVVWIVDKLGFYILYSISDFNIDNLKSYTYLANKFNLRVLGNMHDTPEIMEGGCLI